MGALGRWLRWQATSRLSRDGVVVPFVDSSRLLVRAGMTGATGNIYTGLHEFEEMSFVLHLLRANDLFIDAGANVGTYTVLASAVRGARSVAFEPVPGTYEALVANVKLNEIASLVDTEQCALGRTSGALRFTADLGPANHVLAEGETYDGVVAVVPVRTLDDVLGVRAPALVKLDVEGFESEVLAGAAQMLRRPGLLAVLAECTGAGQRYGATDEATHSAMLRAGFVATRYRPFERRIVPDRGDGPRALNRIYVRDVPKVERRLSSATSFRVLHDLI